MQWYIATNDAGQFFLTEQDPTREGGAEVTSPLLARTAMGDYRIASVKCPQALYFALQDLRATPDTLLKPGDTFWYVLPGTQRITFIGLVEPVLGLVRLDSLNMKMCFGDNAGNDGSLRPETGRVMPPKAQIEWLCQMTRCMLEADTR